MPTPALFKNPDAQISDALRILLKYDKPKTCISLINSRVSEFRAELSVDTMDKKLIEEHFSRFAKTLHLCVTRPQHTQLYIDRYINNPNYYPVGVLVKRSPDAAEYKFFSRLRLVGLGLIGSSIPVFFLNPMVGGLILAGGVTLLILSSLYFLNPNRLNVKEKKEDDEAMFKTIQLIMPADPSDDHCPYSGNLYPRLSDGPLASP